MTQPKPNNKILLAILLFFIICSVCLSGYNTYLYLSKIRSIQNALIALQGSYKSNPQFIKGKDGRNGTDSQSTLTIVQQPLPASPAQNGINGTVGFSAYDLWVQAGNTGTIDTFLSSLKGATGDAGSNGKTQIIIDDSSHCRFLQKYDTDEDFTVLKDYSNTPLCVVLP